MRTSTPPTSNILPLPSASVWACNLTMSHAPSFFSMALLPGQSPHPSRTAEYVSPAAVAAARGGARSLMIAMSYSIIQSDWLFIVHLA